MKVHARLSLALASVVLVFFVAIVLLGFVTRNEIKTLETHRVIDRENFIKNILELKGNLLATFAYDYTYWDDMVQFLETLDPVWAKQNLEEGQSTYKTHMIQVYRLDRSLVYEIVSPEEGLGQKLTFPAEFFERLRKDKFIHLFVNLSSKILEVRGATIHPTSDPERKTPPRGFFIVGKLWTGQEIKELETLTSSDITIKPAGQTDNPNTHGRIFKIPLLNWDGAEIAQVSFLSHSQLLEQLQTESKRFFVIIAIFSSILLAGASIMAQRWVSFPLNRIEKSLNEQSAEPIKVLQKEKTEFGKIALLIEEFFKQKQDLVEQIETIKKLQSMMIQSEKMSAVGQLAAGVSHEINNPLGIILGFAQGLVKQVPPGDQFEMPLKSIEREAYRCKSLVQDLLTFSRVSRMENEPVDLKEPIEAALSLVQADAKVKNVKLIKEISEVPKITANKNQVQQIIINLSNNAIDAMPNGGKLIIRLHQKIMDGCAGAEIQVEDTGTGIPEAIQSKIFDPFFTTKEIGEGTGLGLSLVYEIVQKHGGKIFFETRLNQGTVFHVFLPSL